MPSGERPQRKISRRAVLIGAGLALPVAAWTGYSIWQQQTRPYHRLFTFNATTNVESGSMSRVAWSPDGTRIATFVKRSDGLFMDILQATTGTQLFTCQLGSDLRYSRGSLVWSADSKYLFVFLPTTILQKTRDREAAAFDRVVVWDAATGQHVRNIQTMESLVPSPLGAYSESPFHHDNRYSYWALHERFLALIKERPTEERYQSIIPSDIEVWELATGRKVVTFELEKQFRLKKLSWSPPGDKLAVWSEGVYQRDQNGLSGIQILDARTGQRMHVFPFVGPLSWSPDGKRIALGHGIYDAEMGQFMLGYQVKGTLASHSWSADGKRLIVWSRQAGGLFSVRTGHISVIDTATGRLITAFDEDEALSTPGWHQPEETRDIYWSPTGKGFMVVGKQIEVWDEK
jgi:WD40 repeat protein